MIEVNPLIHVNFKLDLDHFSQAAMALWLYEQYGARWGSLGVCKVVDNPNEISIWSPPEGVSLDTIVDYLVEIYKQSHLSRASFRFKNSWKSEIEDHLALVDLRDRGVCILNLDKIQLLFQGGDLYPRWNYDITPTGLVSPSTRQYGREL